MKKDLKFLILDLIIIYLVLPVFLMDLWILINKDLSLLSLGFFILSSATSGFTIIYLAREISKIMKRRKKRK